MRMNKLELHILADFCILTWRFRRNVFLEILGANPEIICMAVSNRQGIGFIEKKRQLTLLFGTVVPYQAQAEVWVSN